jgi:ABC-type sugar transport system substrate-binding protein
MSEGMKDKTAGLFLLTRQNDYQRLQETAAVAMAQNLKLPLEVHFAENDARVQAQAVYAFIHAHPAGSAVVIEPVNDAAIEQMARHAARAGIGWLLLNRTNGYMHALRLEFPALPIGIVTADQKEIGRIQAKQFEALLRGKGNVLYVCGPAGASASADRLAGMREVLDTTSIRHVSISADWTEQGGEKAVSSWLKGAGASTPIHMVGCQNDAMAAGAARALASAAILGRSGLAQTPVTGVDGNPQFGIDLVDRKRLAATVVMPPVAGQAIELVHGAWNRPDFSIPPIVRLPVRSYPEIGSVTLRAAR